MEIPIPPKSAPGNASHDAAAISRFRTRWGADLAVHEGNLITEEQQWAKLKLVSETARRIWG